MFKKRTRKKVEPVILKPASNISEEEFTPTREPIEDEKPSYVKNAKDDERFGHITEPENKIYESFAECLYFRSTTIAKDAKSCECGNHYRKSLFGCAEFIKPERGEWRLSFLGSKAHHCEIFFRISEILEEDVEYLQRYPKSINMLRGKPEAYFLASRYNGEETFTFQAFLNSNQFNELNSIMSVMKNPVLELNFIIGTTMGYVSEFYLDGFFERGQTIKYFDKESDLSNQNEIPISCKDETDPLEIFTPRRYLQSYGLRIEDENFRRVVNHNTMRFDD